MPEGTIRGLIQWRNAATLTARRFCLIHLNAGVTRRRLRLLDQGLTQAEVARGGGCRTAKRTAMEARSPFWWESGRCSGPRQRSAGQVYQIVTKLYARADLIEEERRPESSSGEPLYAAQGQTCLLRFDAGLICRAVQPRVFRLRRYADSLIKFLHGPPKTCPSPIRTLPLGGPSLRISLFGLSSNLLRKVSLRTYETEFGGRFGRKTEKHVPPFSGCTLLRIRMDPPSRSAIPRATHRPSPVPVSPLVVKNGSKTRLALWAGIPQPLSARVTRSPSTVVVFLRSADWLMRSAKRPPTGTAPHCIDQQSGEYLSNLTGIADDRGAIGLKLFCHRDAFRRNPFSVQVRGRSLSLLSH